MKILQKTGKKLFAAHLEQYAPADPLYEEYVDDKGRKKRRKVGPILHRHAAHITPLTRTSRFKREIPPGLSARDVMILKSVKRRAYHLDKGFSVCGMQFGWTFIIGKLRCPLFSVPCCALRSALCKSHRIG